MTGDLEQYLRAARPSCRHRYIRAELDGVRCIACNAKVGEVTVTRDAHGVLVLKAHLGGPPPFWAGPSVFAALTR